MKKIITAACLVVCSYGYSQSIKLFSVDENRWLNPIDTVEIEISPSTFSENYYLDIANISSNTISLVVKREIIFLVNEAENSFCFDEYCFGSGYDGPTDPYTFSAGDTLFHTGDNEFHTTYSPNGQGGISIIKYIFYDDNNPTDATSVVFKFDSGPVGIKDITNATSLKIYPNPTDGQLKIESGSSTGSLPSILSNVEVYDIYGRKLSDFNFQLSTNEIDISNLSSGMYFLKIDGTVVKIVKN